ncbi:MAG: hypothetical protein OXI96_00255 [Acidimicrobiaceae bacterium]|nr:hypothetical protein [Acidimicrobiaceae bacterium]
MGTLTVTWVSPIRSIEQVASRAVNLRARTPGGGQLTTGLWRSVRTVPSRSTAPAWR